MKLLLACSDSYALGRHGQVLGLASGMALALASRSQAKSWDHQIRGAFCHSSYASFLKYGGNFIQSVDFSAMTFLASIHAGLLSTVAAPSCPFCDFCFCFVQNLSSRVPSRSLDETIKITGSMNLLPEQSGHDHLDFIPSCRHCSSKLASCSLRSLLLLN